MERVYCLFRKRIGGIRMFDDKIITLSTERLKSMGFRQISQYSYSYRFSTLNYNGKPTIECEITMNSSESNENEKNMVINVYDTHHNFYAPYYNRGYGNNRNVSMIERSIKRELVKLGIEL